MGGLISDHVWDRIIHLLHRAEEARSIGEEMTDQHRRVMMEQIAEDYMVLARRYQRIQFNQRRLETIKPDHGEA